MSYQMIAARLHPATWLPAIGAIPARLLARLPARLREALEDECGAEFGEYAMVFALIALVALVGVTAVGVELDRIFDQIDAELAKILP
ncbi:MAG: hypothetical protein F4056_04315 [Chloroflexi bacterium]|nr:hypothetical protein [Chloroflexota bacterium]